MQKDEVKGWLKRRADLLSLSLDESTLDFLIKVLHAQPKSLQNALHALSLRLHLNSDDTKKIDSKKIEVVLADFLAREKQKELNPQKILRAVADHYGMRVDDLLGKSQTKEAAVPRQMAIYLCRIFLRE
jgi:chromosomal replication initiator protein